MKCYNVPNNKQTVNCHNKTDQNQNGRCKDNSLEVGCNDAFLMNLWLWFLCIIKCWHGLQEDRRGGIFKTLCHNINIRSPATKMSLMAEWQNLLLIWDHRHHLTSGESQRRRQETCTKDRTELCLYLTWLCFTQFPWIKGGALKLSTW